MVATTDNREPGPKSGVMSTRAAARLAWSLWALSLGLTALSLFLLSLNLSHPNTPIYAPWLDNTLIGISYAPVGALIASRHPANLVGWLLCLYGVVISISHFGAQYAIYALLAQPDSLPAGEAMAWMVSWLLPIIIGLSIFYILLFPTGRLPSRRWRWLAWLTVAFIVVGVISSAFSSGALMGVLGPIRNPLGVDGFTGIYGAVLYVMSPVLFVSAALSLFVRLHHAVGVERQQIKWFVYAAAASVIATTLAIAALFNPLRHRIQSFIDRRFYRSKYDARRTLETFSATLRDETDLDALSGTLVGVVRETMQPAHVSFWLRRDSSPEAQRRIGLTPQMR